MTDDKEKRIFSKQLDVFIKEIQEKLHLSYKEAIWIIFNGILNSPQFQEEFYILKNETWGEKSVWIGNLKIVQIMKK